LVIPEFIKAGKTDILQKFFEFYKAVTIANVKSKVTDNSCRSTPLAQSKLIGEVLGKYDEIQTWKSEMPEANHKVFDNAYRYSKVIIYYSWRLGYQKSWLDSYNKDRRLALYKWLCLQPGALKALPITEERRRRGYSIGKLLTKEECFSFAQDEEIPTLFRVYILAKQADELEKEKDIEGSLRLRDQILLMTAEEYKDINHVAHIDMANTNIRAQNYVEAERVINKLDGQDVAERLQKRVQNVKNNINKGK